MNFIENNLNFNVVTKRKKFKNWSSSYTYKLIVDFDEDYMEDNIRARNL